MTGRSEDPFARDLTSRPLREVLALLNELQRGGWEVHIEADEE